MTDSAIDDGSARISFEAFGVTMSVATNSREARDRYPRPSPRMAALLRRRRQASLGDLADERGTYAVDEAGVPVFDSVPLDTALDILEQRLCACASHGGARPHLHPRRRGRPMPAAHAPLPGSSFTGKTTLVAALVRAGATYYSDEYAVLDERRARASLPEPLSHSETATIDNRNHHVETLGGPPATDPYPSVPS